ncbi:MAG: RICIN domain-containing protein [Lachnospiraceae bacterium]|nr:RICIN domain-containing protein [Lachnospiraceae bacterium]
MKTKRCSRIVSVFVAMVLTFTSVLNLMIWNNVNGTIAQAAANGISRVCCHDPSVVKANGQYYIFGSHMSFAKSSNLSEWSSFNTNIQSDYASIFSAGAKWSATNDSSYNVSGNLWAPDVIYNSTMGKWCMYMSINGTDWNSSIALATADSIEGPYTYQGTVVYSGFNNSTHPVSMTDYAKVTGSSTVAPRYLKNGSWNSLYGTNAIDPNVFYDASGKLWMVYGSWFGGIFLLELDESTGLRDYNVKYGLGTDASDGVASDPYMGIRIAGGMGASGEAPYIIYKDGYYYLFTSYAGFSSNGGYNMRVFRSSNVSGPYTDAAGNYATYTTAVGSSNASGNVGIRLMSYYRWSCNDVAQIAQGHNSALVDDDGKMYVVYHTRFDDGYECHEVRTHQLFVNQDGWLVAAPYEYLGETISSTGYSKSSVVGTYEFLVQEPNQTYTSSSYDIATSVSINLNSDGTVTGAVTGTWSMTNGTPYMSITYNGVTYKGVFLKQYDESSSRKEVMTFTAVGSNNICIWGSMGTATSSVSYTETTVSDGTYYIRNVNSGKYLDVANGSAENGANVQQWSYNGCDAQKFQIKSDGNGYYYILTGASRYTKCVDIDSGASANGTNVLQWEYWGGDMQKYKIAKNSDGSISFMTKASGCKSALDIYNMSSDDGANANQWEYWGGSGQSWVLESALESANITEGAYYIKNVNSGLYLDVANASSDNGANIQQWEFNGCSAQIFKIKSVGDGYYALLTGTSDYTKCVEVLNGSTENGANIDQWEYWGGNMQLFKIVENSDGSYSFLSKVSNGLQALEVYAFGTANGVNADQWEYWGGTTQCWKLEPVKKNYEGTYYIQNVNSGLYLDVANCSSENGANIQQWAYNGCAAQQYKIVSSGDGYYYILTGASGYTKCVDIYNGSSADGTNVTQWDYWGGNMQKYKIVENSDGSVSFLTVASDCNSALEVYDFSTSNGGNVVQYTYWGGSAQSWKLIGV